MPRPRELSSKGATKGLRVTKSLNYLDHSMYLI